MTLNLSHPHVIMQLWAVHISDGVLTPLVWLSGFVVAGVLLFWSCWKTGEEEVPRIALVTAAFFIASTIHVKVPPTSVHLLLNGLVGLLLGRRAVLAIVGGLILQAILIGHGGFYALGVNTCIMALPALAAWAAYRGLRGRVADSGNVVCFLLVFLCALLVLLSGVFSVAMVAQLLPGESSWQEKLESAASALKLPWVWAPALVVALAAACLERRFHTTGLFAAGFALGSLTVLATSALNCIVLLLGGEDVWPVAPWAMVVLHMPIAVIEGIVLGVTLGFLTRVKPEWLNGQGAIAATARVSDT